MLDHMLDHHAGTPGSSGCTLGGKAAYGPTLLAYQVACTGPAPAVGGLVHPKHSISGNLMPEFLG